MLDTYASIIGPHMSMTEAERWRSAAAGSGSDAGADASGSRLQRFVRLVMPLTRLCNRKELLSVSGLPSLPSWEQLLGRLVVTTADDIVTEPFDPTLLPATKSKRIGFCCLHFDKMLEGKFLLGDGQSE
jgi:hypothetical protein